MSDSVSIVTNPFGWDAYCDPEGPIGRGKEQVDAVVDLLEQQWEIGATRENKLVAENKALRAALTAVCAWSTHEALSGPAEKVPDDVPCFHDTVKMVYALGIGPGKQQSAQERSEGA